MISELKGILSKFGLEYFKKYYGVYRGFIHDNEDPEFYGRLQVQVPQITGDDYIEAWAWPRGMFAGKGIGLFAIPNKGDVVWVSFEGGDPRFPIWEYGWFGDGDIPGNAKNNGIKPTNIVFQSTSGHRIELDDKAGKEAVRIYSKHDHGVEINQKGISLVVPDGKNIFAGSLDNAAEPALLGDKTENVLNDVKDMMQKLLETFTQIATADAAGAASNGLTYPTVYTSSLIPDLTSKIATLVGHIALIKSKKNKLD